MSSIHCRCGELVGYEIPETREQPSEVDLDDSAITDENGEAFCSQECFLEAHPPLCKGCDDAYVTSEFEICDCCRDLGPEEFKTREEYVKLQTLIAIDDALRAGVAA